MKTKIQLLLATLTINRKLVRLLLILWLAIGLETGNCFAQFTFVHISDLHVSWDVSYVNGCDLNGVMAQCYLKVLANLNPKPAFVIATGDISNEGNNSPYGMYPTLSQFLYPGLVLNPGIGAYFIDSAHTIPIYFTPGNHDYRTTNLPPLSTPDLTFYSEYIAPDTDYAVTTHDAVILFMRSGYDTLLPWLNNLNPLSPEGSGLSNAQISWIRSELSANSTRRKIIVMHHPPVNAIGTNSDGTPFTGTIQDTADASITRNRTVFLNICDSNHVDVILAGHEHQNVVANRAGNVIDENWSGGTRYVQTGAAENGSYRVITVDSSFVTVSPPSLCCTTITDFKELSNSSFTNVYPNPATNTLTIENLKAAVGNMQSAVNNIEIYNLLGEKIYSSLVTYSGSPITINIVDIPSGVYIVKVRTEKGVAIKKFIKE